MLKTDIDVGKISHKLALDKATEEYEKYKNRLLEEQHLDSIKELDEHLKQLLPGKQEKIPYSASV